MAELDPALVAIGPPHTLRDIPRRAVNGWHQHGHISDEPHSAWFDADARARRYLLKETDRVAIGERDARWPAARRVKTAYHHRRR